MVARFFPAFDSEALIIDGSSPSGTPGNPVINNSDTPDGTIFTFQSGFPPVEIEIDDTGGDPDVFEDDDGANHEIADGGGIVADGTQVESESVMTFQQIDAGGNPIGDPFEITVYSQNGVTQDVWGFGTTAPLIPGARYVKVSGTNDGDSAYADFVTCFVSGTLIATPDGDLPVETIRPGDLVLTKDHGPQPVRWAGRREVAPTGAFAPVRIQAGAIGNTRDLVVSQQHRVYVSDPRASLLFDTCDVLIPAKTLIDRVPGVYLDTSYWRTTYCHLLFDRHELIWSEGILTESFHPGETALDGVSDAARTELLSLFPELSDEEGLPRIARRPLRAYEARALLRDIDPNAIQRTFPEMETHH